MFTSVFYTLRTLAVIAIFVLSNIVSSRAQDALSDPQKLGALLDTISLKKLKERELGQLIGELEWEKVRNRSLEGSNQGLERQIMTLDLEIKYKYIREQIELKRYGFFKNNQVLPDYSELVVVDTANGGQIKNITIVLKKDVDASSDLQTKVFDISIDFKSEYPVTFAALQSGFVQIQETPFPVSNQIEYIPIQFPRLINTWNTVAEKKKYADGLFAFIQQIDRASEFSQDRVLQTYVALEAKRIPTSNLDQQLVLREKFISYLKNVYQSRKK